MRIFDKKNKEPQHPTLQKLIKQGINQFISSYKDDFVINDLNGREYLQYNSNLIDGITNQIADLVHNAMAGYNMSTSQKHDDNNSTKIDQIADHTYKGLTYDGKDGKRYYAIPEIHSKSINIEHSINEIIRQLADIKIIQQDTIRKNSVVIQKQHDSILRYENDVLFRSKKELLMELIGIADQIKYTLDDQNSDKDYEKLLESVRGLGEWVNGSLQTETVRKYEFTKSDNSILNSKVQEVIDTETTDDIAKDGKYKTILPGYFWTMPLVGSSAMQNIQDRKSFEFVLRPEQVVRLKYVAPNITHEDNSSKKATDLLNCPKHDSEETVVLSQTLVLGMDLNDSKPEEIIVNSLNIDKGGLDDTQTITFDEEEKPKRGRNSKNKK